MKNTYIVRLHTWADHEAAMTLAIEGLNMFAFNQDGKTDSRVLIPTEEFVDIPGWYITSDDTDAFEIIIYADSAAGSQGLTGNIGVITASFSASRDPSEPPPDDEPGSKSVNNRTGRRRRIDQKYQAVRRVIGKVRAIVSVRYARGIAVVSTEVRD